MTLRLLVILLSSAVLMAAEPPEGAIKKELKKLEGIWVVIAVEHKGKRLPERQVKASVNKMEIRSDTAFLFEERLKEKGLKGTLKIDPTVNPKTIEITFSNKDRPPFVGIYKVEGDTLKVCYGQKRRPTTFQTAPDREEAILVYKREKP